MLSWDNYYKQNSAVSLLFPQLKFDGILVPRYIGTSVTASEQEDFIQINPQTDHWRKKKKNVCVFMWWVAGVEVFNNIS